jgi:autophagy-related protein 13
MQKADQIAFHFHTKLFYTINQARATEESHSQGKIDKWVRSTQLQSTDSLTTFIQFNLETPDSDLFTREAREPYRNISLSPPPGPPPLEIQVLLSIPELTNNQVLIHRSDDSSVQQPSLPTTGPSRSQLRIEPTPQSIVLETWTLAFVPHTSNNRLGDQGDYHRLTPDKQTTKYSYCSVLALPTIYKHGIPLFRSLYSLLRILPVWKLYKKLKRRTTGVNRNGHLAISLRVKPSEETDQADDALSILAFGGCSFFYRSMVKFPLVWRTEGI